MALDFGGLMGNAPISPVTAGNQGMAMRFAMQDRELAQANAEEDRQMKIDEVNRQVTEQQRKADVLQKAIAGDPIARAEYVASHAKNANEASFAMDESKKPQREEAVKLAYTEQALSRSNPEAHLKALQDRIELLSNVQAPTPEQQQELAVKRTMLMLPPEQRALMADSVLASFAGDAGLKFMESQRAQNLQPFKVVEARGQAQKAGAEGEFAAQQQQAILDLKRQEVKMKAYEAELKRMQAQGILTPEDQLKQDKLRAEIDQIRGNIETNEGKKLTDAQEKIETNKSAMQTALSTIDTANKLLKHPGFNGTFGMEAYIPALPGTDAADAGAILEQLNSQTFMAGVDQMRGLGALTEAEGKKITSSIANIKPTMSEKAAKVELNNIITMMTRAKMRAEKMIQQQNQKIAPVMQKKAVSIADDLNSKY